MEKKEIGLKTLRTKNVVDFGKFSYSLEEKREKNLLNQSNRMIAIFLASFAMLYGVLKITSGNINIPIRWLLMATLIIAVILLMGLALATIAQWRYKYKTMLTAKEFNGYFAKDRDSYKSQEQYNYQWMDQLDIIHRNKRLNNDKRAKLIIASNIMFFIAIGLLILSIFIVLFFI